MPSPYLLIQGGAELLTWSGGQHPTFHDAEVVGLDLRRRSPSRLQVHWWRPRPSARNPRVLEQADDVVVTFVLTSVVDLKLTDFSVQNVINELVLRQVPTDPGAAWMLQTAQEQLWKLELAGCYGLYGTITAAGVAIELAEGEPDDFKRIRPQ